MDDRHRLDGLRPTDHSLAEFHRGDTPRRCAGNGTLARHRRGGTGSNPLRLVSADSAVAPRPGPRRARPEWLPDSTLPDGRPAAQRMGNAPGHRTGEIRYRVWADGSFAPLRWSAGVLRGG